MAWWIMVRELADDSGKPLGRYRLTAESDEDGGGPWALCDCEGGHATESEARECPVAKKEEKAY